MSDANRSRQTVRKPNSWGLQAADRVGERISIVHNRLGFDLITPWALFSLETYEGKMGNLENYLLSHLTKAYEYEGYQDRKAIFWSWPSLALIKVPFVEVHDAEKADVSRIVDTETEPFSTWYQVRNNMVHSGKDGKRDLQILRDAVKGMVTLLTAVIHSEIPDLKMGN